MATKISNYGSAFNNWPTTSRWNNSPSSTFKNYLINGDFSVDEKNMDNPVSALGNQTGFSSAYRYTPERWIGFSSESGNTPFVTFTRLSMANTSTSAYYPSLTTSGGVTPLHPHANALRVQKGIGIYGSIDMNYGEIGIAQRIESWNCIDLCHQNMTLSFWAKGKQANQEQANVVVTVYESAGKGTPYGTLPWEVDNWNYPGYATQGGGLSGAWKGNTNVIMTSNVTASNTTEGFFEFNFRLAENAYRGVMVEIKMRCHSNSTNEYFQVTGIQLEKGNKASNFEILSSQQQLKLARRYSYTLRNTNNGILGQPDLPIETYFFGGPDSGSFSGGLSSPWGRIKLPVSFRAQPNWSNPSSALRTYFYTFDTSPGYKGLTTKFQTQDNYEIICNHDISTITTWAFSQYHIDLKLPITSFYGGEPRAGNLKPAYSVYFRPATGGPFTGFYGSQEWSTWNFDYEL
jgi:hypothetical protein